MEQEFDRIANQMVSELSIKDVELMEFTISKNARFFRCQLENSVLEALRRRLKEQQNLSK